MPTEFQQASWKLVTVNMSMEKNHQRVQQVSRAQEIMSMKSMVINFIIKTKEKEEKAQKVKE